MLHPQQVRITVLTYVEQEGSDAVDLVVPQLEAALRAGGHEVSVLAVHADLGTLVAGLRAHRPDLVFNVLEEFAGRADGNLGVCGVLDALGLPYTGCNAAEYYLGQDKVLAKKLLAFEEIRSPRFAVFGRDQRLETGGNLRMPMFVKPASMDGSLGIDRRSLVHDSTSLMKRVVEIHETLKDDALAEQYIPGREFYVGVLGNEDPITLPPIEVDFSRLPEDAPRIYCRRAKWEPGTPEHDAIKTRVVEVSDELRARLNKISVEAYRALRVRDYGRVDLRVAETGEIYVLEVNAACYLERNDEFAMAAQAAGIEYEALIARIVELAIARARRAS